MLTVYGADWCEDTRRSLRHLRRLGVPHQYLNIDEDAAALERARALNDGTRRTPTIDLGVGGGGLVEPDNDTLAGALVELEMLTQEDLHERLALQNVGDTERVIRVGAGTALLLGGGLMPRGFRWPLRLAGFAALLSGLAGWCPVYHARGVTSLGGPGDRPDEATRRTWLATSVDRAAGGPAAVSPEAGS
jgi:mycoredoxin